MILAHLAVIKRDPLVSMIDMIRHKDNKGLLNMDSDHGGLGLDKR